MNDELGLALIAWLNMSPSQKRRFVDLVIKRVDDEVVSSENLSEGSGYMHMMTGPVGMPCRLCGRT